MGMRYVDPGNDNGVWSELTFAYVTGNLSLFDQGMLVRARNANRNGKRRSDLAVMVMIVGDFCRLIDRAQYAENLNPDVRTELADELRMMWDWYLPVWREAFDDPR